MSALTIRVVLPEGEKVPSEDELLQAFRSHPLHLDVQSVQVMEVEP